MLCENMENKTKWNMKKRKKYETFNNTSSCVVNCIITVHNISHV